MKQLLKRTLSILLAAAMTVSAGAAVAMAEDGYATRGEVCEMLLTAADMLARSVAQSELPVSIFTSLLGAPFLLYLILKREEPL